MRLFARKIAIIMLISPLLYYVIIIIWKYEKYIDYMQFFVSIILLLSIWFLKKKTYSSIIFNLIFLTFSIFKFVFIQYHYFTHLRKSFLNINLLTKIAYRIYARYELTMKVSYFSTKLLEDRDSFGFGTIAYVFISTYHLSTQDRNRDRNVYARPELSKNFPCFYIHIYLRRINIRSHVHIC